MISPRIPAAPRCRAALAGVMVLIACSLAAAQDEGGKPPGQEPEARTATPRTRMFHISMRQSYSTMPKQVQEMNFWFPLPFEDEHQKIYNRYFETPYEIEGAAAPDTGNQILHMKGGPRGGLPMQVRVRFDAERSEDLRNPFEAAAAKPPAEKEKGIMERWLRPDSMTLIDRDLRGRASKVTSGRRKPVEKARAIYDYIAGSLTLIENPSELRGAGYGNVAFTLKEMKGDPVDFASAFVGLCRAAGIPARTIIGLKIPSEIRTGSISLYHSWAEFYLQEVGWVPVDPVDGQRDASKRPYYFGALDENRLAVSIGRDIILVPPQSGQPLNYFINPYWEGDAKVMPSPWIEIEFKELDSIEKQTIEMQPAAGDEPATATQPASPPEQKPPR